MTSYQSRLYHGASRLPIVVGGYALVALLTFGYAASNAACKPHMFSLSTVQECRAMTGLVAGISWPLFWSWEAFDALK